MLASLRSLVANVFKSRIVPWALLGVVLGVAAILSASGERSSPEVAALSSRVGERAKDYGRGVELILAGEEAMGRNLLVSATDRMTVAAHECARVPGCSMATLLGGLTASLDEQLDALDRSKGGLRGFLSAFGPEQESSSPWAPAAPVALGESPTEDTETAGAIHDVEEMKRAASMLRGVDLRELVRLNDPVERALNDWLTWNRPQLTTAYENYLFLRAEIAPIFEGADLPEALLFGLMAQETGVKVHSYSRAGAAGPLQFMPRTGARYGLVRVAGFDMRLDPVASTRATAEYLNVHLSKFSDDLAKTLAAYNGGESRMTTIHRKAEDASFWDPEVYYGLPSETRDYVPGVLAAAWIFLHPEEYELKEPDLEFETSSIVLAEDLSIGEITICIGNERNPKGWFRTLRNLNPRRKANERIAAGETLKVPSMLVPAFVERCSAASDRLERARALHEAAYEAEGAWVKYRVRRGDTLASIAARFDCATLKKLAGMNGIKGPAYAIRVGQRLSVPTCG